MTETPMSMTPLGAARVFARLRWRLIRSSFRGRANTVVPTVLSMISALAAGILACAAGVGSSSARFTDARPIITGVAAFAGLAALILPVTVLGSDDSLSAARLSPFPLSADQRMAGWIGSTLAGPYGIALLIGLIGLLIGQTRSVAGAVIGFVATAVLAVTFAVSSRLVVTLLAPLMAGRRGRDIGVMIGALLGMSGWVFSQVGRVTTGMSTRQWRSIDRFARWSPTGAAARAVVNAGHGHLGPAIASLAIALGGAAAMAMIWRWSVQRVDAGMAAADSGSPATTTSKSLFSGVRGRLPRTQMGAVAARELTYAGRDPKWRVSILTMIIIGTVLPFANSLQDTDNPEVTMRGALAGLLGALSAFNLVGFEGRALWIHLLSGVAPRTYLRGKALAILLLFTPVVVINVVGLAALSNGWAYLPAGLLLGLGALGCGIGVGAVAGIIAPQAPPESSNPFASPSGRGCVTGLLSLVAMTVLAILQLPATVAIFFAHDRPFVCALIGVANLTIAFGVWRAGTAMASERMVGREPELQALVVPVG
jgi:ABC-2 type transport system permease protein